MKTVRIKIYRFSELSKSAKETALNDWKYNTGYVWEADAIKSLEKFAEHFNCTLTYYDIDFNSLNGSSVKFDIYRNNLISEQDIKDKIESMGRYNKETLKGDGDCVFTGYSADEDAADGAREAFYKGERNIENLLMAGYNTWFKAAKSDYKAQQSAKYYSDHADSNDYYFTENGKLY